MMSTMSFSGISLRCGPWKLPQQTCSRTFSRGMERRAEILELLSQRLVADVIQRRDAAREALSHRGARESAPARAEVQGKLPQIARGDVERSGIHPGPVIAHLDPRDALAHVVGEIALSELPVVDAVDAAGDLPAHDLRHFALQARG